MRDHGSGAPWRGLLATLVARAPEHLLVLLLAHALTALLDQRTHTAGEATCGSGTCAIPWPGVRRRDVDDGFPGSFNGRTSGFGPEYGGSSPPPGAMNLGD